MLALPGCDLSDEGIPPGKLATVGPTVFGPEDVAAVQAQLGAYAQLRFLGGEGRQQLLEALVTTELLAQEAIEHGLGDDPRVEFAVLEEIASVYISAELERRVPTEAIAADVDALRAYYDAHPDAFTRPERRSVRGVVFKTFAAGEAALAKLIAGEAQLEDYGEVFATKLRPRDDNEYPAYHRFLFDPAVQAGTFIPQPVFIGETLMVAFVQMVEPPTLEPFEDPKVQQRLVQAVGAERRAVAQVELRAELRERFPERAP